MNPGSAVVLKARRLDRPQHTREFSITYSRLILAALLAGTVAVPAQAQLLGGGGNLAGGLTGGLSGTVGGVISGAGSLAGSGNGNLGGSLGGALGNGGGLGAISNSVSGSVTK